MGTWPPAADRYDPYDPAHPMWRDPFWRTYAARPTPPPPKPPADRPPAPG